MSCGVTVAYSEVHQAFQIALAAHEIGMLDNFLCSLFVAPGKWGGLLSLFAGKQLLMNRTNAVPPSKVREYPWPLLTHHAKIRLLGKNYEPWTATNPVFDKWAAKQLEQSESRIFVGSETCAHDCFVVAEKAGMVRILDSPQVHSTFLIQTLRKAYDTLGKSFSNRIDNAEIADRKEKELSLANIILVYSEVHKQSFIEAGLDPDRLVEIPLWADAALWDRPHMYRAAAKRSLEVLFVGGIGIRKGVPWLLEAIRRLRRNVKLTLVGSVEPDFRQILQSFEGFYTHIEAQPRGVLRHFYANADLLVLPSLVDSFGFVAMEAMLAGLPVIVSENCGVPVPENTWRVPIMNSEAIENRLSLYISEPHFLSEHGLMAKEFARSFTPKRYRDKIGNLFQRLLAV